MEVTDYVENEANVSDITVPCGHEDLNVVASNLLLDDFFCSMPMR